MYVQRRKMTVPKLTELFSTQGYRHNASWCIIPTLLLKRSSPVTQDLVDVCRGYDRSGIFILREWAGPGGMELICGLWDHQNAEGRRG